MVMLVREEEEEERFLVVGIRSHSLAIRYFGEKGGKGVSREGGGFYIIYIIRPLFLFGLLAYKYRKCMYIFYFQR